MALSLTYYIFEGVLVGPGLHISAGSGGGAGSTKSTPSFSAGNPYATGLKTKGKGKAHIHGGPIPAGVYAISVPKHHSHLGMSAQLTPRTPLPNKRGGFYIHGRGPHGSDGCIVPMNKSDFDRLIKLIRGSGGGTLVVAETMGTAGFA